jgi:hypothetical protein
VSLWPTRRACFKMPKPGGCPFSKTPYDMANMLPYL